MTHSIEIDGQLAAALGLTGYDRKTVADRLAELGRLPTPTRSETEAFLVEVLASALAEILSGGAAWSWGEFHKGGLQPLYDISREGDWPRMAACAADLGVHDRHPTVRDGEILTPRDALARNLVEATERLLVAVRERLEAAGVSPYA